MDRWNNCVAVVTGASSGIGAAIVKDLVRYDMKVVGLARRKERIEEFKKTLPEEQQKRLIAIKCDVSSLQSVNEAFDEIIKKFGGVDILINNAGTITVGQLSTMDANTIKSTLDVNVMGVVYCTQRAFKSMKERNFNGHVIIINSTLGHVIPYSSRDLPPYNIYPPSKFAVTAMTEIYRQEFSGLQTKIKITSVSPGLTDTDIVPNEWKTNNILHSEDIAQCVNFALSTPPHVQIHELTVRPF